MVRCCPESLCQTDDIDDLEHDIYNRGDVYLCQARSPSRPVPAGADLALLPRRLFAFALNDRKFVPIDMRYVKTVHVQADTFSLLQVPAAHKEMITAVVRFHLGHQVIKQRLEKNGSAPLRTQDFIRGKGRGLKVLHGPPGVGKTGTAEAEAQSMGRAPFSGSLRSYQQSPCGRDSG